MTDRLALPRRYRDQLEALLREHVPGVEVWAYGSRVNGESHDGSDLDLALRGPALEPLDGGFNDLLEAIEKSTIPILVQAHDWARLPESFHREIERDCVVVQEGAKQTAANSWREVALGDVAEIVMGQSPPGDKVSGDNGLALLNGPTEFGASHPTPVQFTIDARKYAQPGDILFCVRGSTTGRMNWADQEYAIGRGVAAIRHKNDSALQPFIRGVIELGLSELLAQATGSTFPNVSAQQLAEIPYPSLDEDEQRAIAHILGTLDDKIELNRRTNQTLEKMARAIFQDWFVEFGPTRAKIQGLDPYLPSELWDLFPDKLVGSELGKIPEGWEVKSLGDLSHKPQYGYTASASPDPTIGPKFLRITDINKKDWTEWETVPHCDIEDEDLEKYRLYQNDILIARMADPGHGCMIEEKLEAVFASYLIRFRPKHQLHARFLQYWLRSNQYWELVRERGTGTTRTSLNAKVLGEFELAVPTGPLAEAFGDQAHRLRERVVANVNESANLAAQRDTMLQKLMSGEFRMTEVDSDAPHFLRTS